jgi:hypothetical protein
MMMSGSKPEVPRAPRLGIDPARVAHLGLDFPASECCVVQKGQPAEAKLVSITNISVGGIKVAIAEATRPPLMNDSVVLKFVGRERSWNIKGRVAWVQAISGGQWWIGIEFAFTADATLFYKALTE